MACLVQIPAYLPTYASHFGAVFYGLGKVNDM